MRELYFTDFHSPVICRSGGHLELTRRACLVASHFGFILYLPWYWCVSSAAGSCLFPIFSGERTRPTYPAASPHVSLQYCRSKCLQWSIGDHLYLHTTEMLCTLSLFFRSTCIDRLPFFLEFRIGQCLIWQDHEHSPWVRSCPDWVKWTSINEYVKLEGYVWRRHTDVPIVSSLVHGIY